MKKDKHLFLWITSGGLAVFAAVFLFLAFHLGSGLNSQLAAERWRGESELRFTQISCFLPIDEKLSLDKIYRFRQNVQNALHEASVDAAYSGQLSVDAWSTTGKLQASTELGKGEARVIAVGGSFFQFHPLRLLSGNYITESDVMKDRVLLDEDLAWLLFGGVELTGLSLRLNGVPFVVAGVIEREQDSFSRRAYTDGMGLYMSYEAYQQLEENAGIDCYELVMAEPVKGFALNLTREKFPIGRGVILQNTDRFSFSRLLDVIGGIGTRSMQTQGVIYPYWENACRSAEDLSALCLILGTLFAVFPAILLIHCLLRLLKRGKTKLSEDLLPAAVDHVEEAVRVRQRRAWERRQGKHEKR